MAKKIKKSPRLIFPEVVTNKKLLAELCKLIEDTASFTAGISSLVLSDELTTIQVIGLLEGVERNSAALSRLIHTSLEGFVSSIYTEVK